MTVVLQRRERGGGVGLGEPGETDFGRWSRLTAAEAPADAADTDVRLVKQHFLGLGRAPRHLEHGPRESTRTERARFRRFRGLTGNVREALELRGDPLLEALSTVRAKRGAE